MSTLENYEESEEEKWHDSGITPTKDKRMAMTEENFTRVIAMRDELILEQKDEISKLKHELNNTKAKLESKRYQINKINET